MKRKITYEMFWILVALLGVGALLVPLAAENPSGRDIGNRGTFKTLTGTLAEKDGEWYLRASEGEYGLHLGNYEVIYPRGIDLKAGTQAEVHGFVLQKDVAPIWIKNQNRTYKFRDADGTPLWSGNGQGRNRNLSGTGSRRNG